MSETKNGKEANKLHFAPDSPIASATEDLFRHLDFVDVLEYAIEHTETPLNIALYGRWGVGKSSILNLLQERLEKKEELNKKYQYAYIDAWKLSPESLRQELLVELNNKFNALKTEEIEDRLWNVREELVGMQISKWRRIWNGIKPVIPYGILFGAILTAGSVVDQFTEFDLWAPTFFVSVIFPIIMAVAQRLGSVSKDLQKTSKRIIPKAESSHQFQQLFYEIISHRKTQRLVIAVDNLDRCEDEAVVKILGTIKTFMNTKDCIYIIPCDEQAIIKHLMAARGGEYYQERDSIEFLNKFFQITLHIPPYLEGDLESYVDRQMSKFEDIKFDDNVKDVLILGMTKNPRKIRHFVYNLVVIYKLAEAKERAGIIQKQIVTGNTGFLAKLIVLRDEWPDFYRRLEQREDLLELLQRYLDEGRVEELPNEEIQDIFETNDGLDWFLKRTRLVSTANVSPFLKLNQESFESTISDLGAFKLKVSQGEVDSVRIELEKLEQTDREHYVKEVLRLIDDYIRNGRFQFAFNSMNVLLEVYQHIPESLRGEVLSQFSIHMMNPQIKESLHAYNTSKLFPLVLQMQMPNRDALLKQYCKALVRNDLLDETVFHEFVRHNNTLSNSIIGEFNSKLGYLVRRNNPQSVNAIKILMTDNEVANKLVKPELVDSLIQRIDSNTNQENKERVEMYLQLKGLASTANKLTFVKKILTIAELNKGNTIDNNLQFAIDILNKLDKDDLPLDVSITLYDSMKTFVPQMSDENHKAKVIQVLLRGFSTLDEPQKKEFAEQHLAPLIASLGSGFLSLTATAALNANARILDYEPLLNNCINRQSQFAPIIDVIKLLLLTIPKDKRKNAIDAVCHQLRTSPSEAMPIVASVLQQVLN
ncbi:MAG: KAP family P-loop NTPase fold protein, partial [Nitrososphaerales archaeon]